MDKFRGFRNGGTFSALESEMEVLQSKYEDLELKNEHLELKNEHLESKYKHLESKYKRLTSRLESKNEKYIQDRLKFRGDAKDHQKVKRLIPALLAPFEMTKYGKNQDFVNRYTSTFGPLIRGAFISTGSNDQNIKAAGIASLGWQDIEGCITKLLPTAPSSKSTTLSTMLSERGTQAMKLYGHVQAHVTNSEGRKIGVDA